MRVLVTGAAGRVGANMVKRLASTGADVKAMVMPGDTQASKLRAIPEVQIVEADLTDQASVDRACRNVTHVVHLAAQLVRAMPVDRYYDINAFGTLRLLEGVVSAGGVERFVLASTDGTYRPGDPPSVPLPEDAPQEPADYYGTSKLLGEIILRNHAAQFDIPFVITRFATVLSPEEATKQFTLDSLRELLQRAKLGRGSNIWQLFRDHPDMAEILDQAAAKMPGNTPVGLIGPNHMPWSIHLLDVRDAVEGVYLALTATNAEGRAFNIAAAEPTSHEEGASVISEACGLPKLMVEMPVTWRLEMTIDAARATLGYRPKHDFRSMVEAGRAPTLDGPDRYIPARV